MDPTAALFVPTAHRFDDDGDLAELRLSREDFLVLVAEREYQEEQLNGYDEKVEKEEEEAESEGREEDWTSDSGDSEISGAHLTPGDGPPVTMGVHERTLRRAISGRPRRTIDDIKHKRCFICYDEEDGAEQTGRRRTLETEWIHACRCSLIAHHQCLLSWISQWEKAHQGSAPKCPACQFVFQLNEPRSRALLVLTFLKKLWRVGSIGIAGFATIAGLYAGMGAYGKWAIRQFAGREVANLVTSRIGVPWYSRALNGTPFIPVVLIVGRTASVDSIFPFIPLGFILSALSSYPQKSIKNDILGLPHLSPSFPPSPAFLVALFPWLRLGYLKARTRVFRACGVEVGNWYDTVFQDPEIQPPPDQLLQPHEITSLGKICAMTVETLLFPLASAIVGSSLLYLSTRSRTSRLSITFRQILCVQLPSPSRLSFGLIRASTGTGSGNGLGLGIDPIWVRNTVGAGIVLVLRDGVQLVHGILRRRRIEKRRIVGRDLSNKLDLDS